MDAAGIGKTRADKTAAFSLTSIHSLSQCGVDGGGEGCVLMRKNGAQVEFETVFGDVSDNRWTSFTEAPGKGR